MTRMEEVVSTRLIVDNYWHIEDTTHVVVGYLFEKKSIARVVCIDGWWFNVNIQ